MASEQRLDASAFTRTFNLQRLKSQICFIYLTEGVSFACGKFLFIQTQLLHHHISHRWISWYHQIWELLLRLWLHHCLRCLLLLRWCLHMFLQLQNQMLRMQVHLSLRSILPEVRSYRLIQQMLFRLLHELPVLLLTQRFWCCVGFLQCHLLLLWVRHHLLIW